MSDSRNREIERAYQEAPADRENVRRYLVSLLRSGRGIEPIVTRLVGELTQANRGRLRLPRKAKLNFNTGDCELCGVSFTPDDDAFYLATLRNPESPLPSHSDTGRTAHQLPWDAAVERRRFADCTCNGDGVDWTPRGTTKVIRVHEWGCALKGKYWEFVKTPGVWEHLVHCACADEHGYQTPRYSKGRADPGHRTRGTANADGR